MMSLAAPFPPGVPPPQRPSPRPTPKQGFRFKNVRTFKSPRCHMDLQETSYYVGKSITLWVMFTTSLNWMMYRKIRKEAEADEKDKR